jgi:hypothetical protein
MIGQGGVMDAVWIVRPNTTIPAGTYTVIDSDPGSWSENSISGGAGFSHIMRPKKGVKTQEKAASPVSVKPAATRPVRECEGGTIEGKVYRPDGEPADGATYFVKGSPSAITSGKGEFTVITGESGPITIEFSYKGHHQTKITVTVSNCETKTIRVQLPKD